MGGYVYVGIVLVFEGKGLEILQLHWEHYYFYPKSVP